MAINFAASSRSMICMSFLSTITSGRGACWRKRSRIRRTLHELGHSSARMARQLGVETVPQPHGQRLRAGRADELLALVSTYALRAMAAEDQSDGEGSHRGYASRLSARASSQNIHRARVR